MIDTKKNKNYQLKTENNKLIFKTSFFKAEKTSVLHGGVYTKEFASMLFASGSCVFAYMFIAFISIDRSITRYIILVFIFIVMFLVSKKFIFKNKYLETIFDNSNKTVNISRTGIITKNIEKILFADIKSVELGSRKFIPENIDGIKFVQKISLQHGSAVPGLDDVEEFITMSLKLTDGSERIIYAVKIDGGKIDGEPKVPLNEIRNFLSNNV